MQLVASTALSENNEIESFDRRSVGGPLSQTTQTDRQTDGRTDSDTERRTPRRYQRKQTVPRRQLSMHVMQDERRAASAAQSGAARRVSVVISRSILHASSRCTACQSREKTFASPTGRSFTEEAAAATPWTVPAGDWTVNSESCAPSVVWCGRGDTPYNDYPVAQSNSHYSQQRYMDNSTHRSTCVCRSRQNGAALSPCVFCPLPISRSPNCFAFASNDSIIARIRH